MAYKNLKLCKVFAEENSFDIFVALNSLDDLDDALQSWAVQEFGPAYILDLPTALLYHRDVSELLPKLKLDNRIYEVESGQGIVGNGYVLRGNGSPIDRGIGAGLAYLYEDAENGNVWIKYGINVSNWNRIGDANSIEETIVATENVPAFNVITLTGQIANSAILAHRDRIIGITKTAIDNTFSGFVVTEGYIKNTAWNWTKGNVLYLNGAGSLSVTAPSAGFISIIGKALSNQEIYVKILESILL